MMKINLEIYILSQKFPIFVSEIINIGIEVLSCRALMNPNILQTSHLSLLLYIYVQVFLWAGLRILTQFFPFSKRERLPQCCSSTVAQS